jgi:hypothetical protein
VARDVAELLALPNNLVLPHVETMFPLWRRRPPNWYLDPSGNGLLFTFQPALDEEPQIVVQSAKLVYDELIDAIAKDPDLLHQLNNRRFEELVACIWENHGFDVALTAQTRDQGRSVIAVQRTLTSTKYLIECKKLPKKMGTPTRLVGA